MNRSYFATVKEGKESYFCQFIDIPECMVQSKTKDIAELCTSASLVCSDLLNEYKKDGTPIPASSTFEEATRKANGEPLLVVCVTLPSPSVRISITVPEAKLEMIDKAAKKVRMNRSEYLVESALSAAR